MFVGGMDRQMDTVGREGERGLHLHGVLNKKKEGREGRGGGEEEEGRKAKTFVSKQEFV